MDQYKEVKKLVEEKENEINLLQSAFRLYHLFITGSDNMDSVTIKEATEIANGVHICKIADTEVIVSMRFKLTLDNCTDMKNKVIGPNERFYNLRKLLLRFSNKYLKRQFDIAFDCIYDIYEVDEEVSLQTSVDDTTTILIKFTDKRKSVTEADRYKHLNNHITEVIKYLTLGYLTLTLGDEMG